MRDHLVCNSSGIPSHPSGLKAHAAVKTSRLHRLRKRQTNYRCIACGLAVIRDCLRRCRSRCRGPPLCRRLGGDLTRCGLRLHQHSCACICQSHALPVSQTTVATTCFVVTVRIRKRILLPSEQAQPVADSVEQDFRLYESREVQITRKVLNELLYHNLVTAP